MSGAVIRRWDLDVWEQVEAHLLTRRARRLLRRRQLVSERIFADAKVKHGLDRAQFRGRAKMQIHSSLWSISAIVINSRAFEAGTMSELACAPRMQRPTENLRSVRARHADSHLAALVRAGATFVDGLKVEREDQRDAA